MTKIIFACVSSAITYFGIQKLISAINKKNKELDNIINISQTNNICDYNKNYIVDCGKATNEDYSYDMYIINNSKYMNVKMEVSKDIVFYHTYPIKSWTKIGSITNNNYIINNNILLDIDTVNLMKPTETYITTSYAGAVFSARIENFSKLNLFSQKLMESPSETYKIVKKSYTNQDVYAYGTISNGIIDASIIANTPEDIIDYKLSSQYLESCIYTFVGLCGFIIAITKI